MRQGEVAPQGKWIGDPFGGVKAPEALILPDPATRFARTAARLEALSAGHPMTEWLRFMARLAQAQHRVATTLRPFAGWSRSTVEQAVDARMPPLAADGSHRRDPMHAHRPRHLSLHLHIPPRRPSSSNPFPAISIHHPPPPPYSHHPPPPPPSLHLIPLPRRRLSHSVSTASFSLLHVIIAAVPASISIAAANLHHHHPFSVSLSMSRRNQSHASRTRTTARVTGNQAHDIMVDAFADDLATLGLESYGCRGRMGTPRAKSVAAHRLGRNGVGAMREIG